MESDVDILKLIREASGAVGGNYVNWTVTLSPQLRIHMTHYHVKNASRPTYTSILFFLLIIIVILIVILLSSIYSIHSLPLHGTE